MTLYQKTLGDFQQSYVGFAALVIIGQSCLGGVAAMYILENGTNIFQMIQLGLVVITCTLVNVSILAQLSPKTVFNMTIFSAVLSILAIAMNVLII
ncbi:hypothetical protein L1S35_02340 [Flavobacterium sp. AS60]|uniref:hypothetical protein n=1 Tax=Flavobacterium anseongense TaxID=2910677 RepID=UPI001F26CCCC|nr:hypothetical protein [Flavobacterium sp. AS60]MCF6128494.1 hypothetical protein [Flavobacterium sp. AS60]